jgi:hypothetical protein
LAGIIITIALLAKSPVADWLTVIWLCSWSVAGSRLLGRAPAELSPLQSRRVLSAIMLFGLIGLALIWFFVRPAPQAMIVGLLWWSISASLWIESLNRLFRLRNFLPLVVASLGLLPFPPALTIMLLLASSFFILAPFTALPDLRTFLWLKKYPGELALLALYGAAMGFFFAYLFTRYQNHVVLGGTLLTIILITTDWLILWLRRVLSKSLWQARSREDFNQLTWQMTNVVPRLLVLVALIALLVWLQYSGSTLAVVIAHFGLVGLSLSLAVVLFSLDNLVLPSILFMLAALMLLLSVPLSWTLLALIISLMLSIIVHLRDVESYGVQVA